MIASAKTAAVVLMEETRAHPGNRSAWGNRVDDQRQGGNSMYRDQACAQSVLDEPEPDDIWDNMPV